MSDRVIVVEDDREVRSYIEDLLEESGYDVAAYASAPHALRALEAGETADVVVTDLMMPGMNGDELLQRVRRERPELNVVIITAFGSIESAIELVKRGAYDYITKPFATQDLLLAVERALGESAARRTLARRSGPELGDIIGASPPMLQMFRTLPRAALSRHPVLILGESGTGKDLVARTLHRMSGRGTFVALNCAAIPAHLLESELFGHEKGAFSGADRTKRGMFEEAHDGTLFLDEVAELPSALQPKLLRALENGEIRRVGATASRNVNVRIIAATNKDLEEEVAEGRFREDLFWRLNVLNLTVPPLRERTGDIPLLAEWILQREEAPVAISPEALTLLSAYGWPGNVRELRNALHYAATLAESGVITPADLPPRIRESARVGALLSDAVSGDLTLRELERAYIAEILRKTNGNKSRAADILGIDRATLYRKLEEYRSEES